MQTLMATECEITWGNDVSEVQIQALNPDCS